MFTVQHFLLAWSPALACSCTAEVALQFLDLERDGFDGRVRDVSVRGWWGCHDGVVVCFEQSGLSLYFQVEESRGWVERGMVAVELFADDFHALARRTVGGWSTVTGRGRI